MSSTKMAISLQQRWNKASVDSFLQYSEEYHGPYSTLNKGRMATVVSKTYLLLVPWAYILDFSFSHLAKMRKPCCSHFRFESMVNQERLAILICVNPSLNSSPTLLWSYFFIFWLPLCFWVKPFYFQVKWMLWSINGLFVLPQKKNLSSNFRGFCVPLWYVNSY